MGIQRRGKKGTYYFYMRVPKRYAEVDCRRFVQLSLNTDALAVAHTKEADLRKLCFARWDALLAGRDDDAAAYYSQLVKICELSGFSYMPAVDVAAAPLREILDRVDAVDLDAVETSDALLGSAAPPALLLSSLFDLFKDLSEVDLQSKSPMQRKRWENVPRRAAKTFQAVLGVDVSLLDLTRADGLKYRDHLGQRVIAGEISKGAANRLMYTVGGMIKRVAKLHAQTDVDIFKGLLFKEVKTKRRAGQVAFSVEWIREKFVLGDNFKTTNADARDIFLAMINTGARPSELVAMQEPQIRLGANIPHIVIAPEGRELKTVHSERAIPLVGVSLEAFRRHPGGFKRYDNPDSYSAIMMKYLRGHGLLEGPAHKVYSLRHSFRDRLRNVGCPDSIAEDLMGHEIHGTDYGEGVPLDVSLTWLMKIGL